MRDVDNMNQRPFHNRFRGSLGSLLFAGVLSVCGQVVASDLTVLHSFGYQPDGEYPEGRLLQGSDGSVYGTTNAGGVNGYGMAFGIAPDGTFTTLHSFTGADGQQLVVGMTMGSDDKLYGTTPQGTTCVGSSCTGFGGSVFRLSTSGVFKTLYAFSGNGLPNGYSPGELTDGGDGYFFGTTSYGGAAGVSGLGTVFKIAPNGALTTLHSFTSTGPFYPMSGLTLGPDGNFYGATQNAPGNDNGAIFSVTPTGAVTTVHSFTGTDGSFPGGRLLLARNGNFYGTTGGGGAFGAGTVYMLTPSGTLTTLYSFNGGDGTGPAPGLVQTADGSFYGVTSGGGSGGGTIFKMTPAGAVTTLHLFIFSDGMNPGAGPILGSDGRLYGTATQGGGGAGILPTGSVYEFDPAAPHDPVLSLTKVCYNEFDECLPPIDTAVGGFVGLVWYSANLSGCRATGAWLGAKPTGGNVKFEAKFPGAYTYTLTCNGANGPISASTTIRVAR
jgi:uncharacterized repeat protein (TIGR03803 family)